MRKLPTVLLGFMLSSTFLGASAYAQKGMVAECSVFIETVNQDAEKLSPYLEKYLASNGMTIVHAPSNAKFVVSSFIGERGGFLGRSYVSLDVLDQSAGDTYGIGAYATGLWPTPSHALKRLLFENKTGFRLPSCK